VTPLLIPTPTVWRRIPHAPERYEASNTGVIRIRSREVDVIRKNGTVTKRYLEGRYLNPYVRSTGKSKGHPVVSLAAAAGDRSKIGEIRVCLLVARAFHGTPYKPGDSKGCQKWRILHKDADITNNCADNLQWIGNGGVNDDEGRALYERNLRRLEELRREPVEDWIKRIWGENYPEEVA